MKLVWRAALVAAVLAVSIQGAPKPEPDPHPKIPPPPPSIELTPEGEALLAQLLELAEAEGLGGGPGEEETDRTRRTSGHWDKHSHSFNIGSLSSYDHYHDKHHDIHQKAVNVWGFKKAILASLLQAVKAVTGGVIALKGAVLKGTGYVVEGTGKILEHKGEAIKDFGKHVVHKALTKPIHVEFTSPGWHGHGGHGHVSQGHGGHGAGPGYVYQSSGYGSPLEHHHYYHHEPQYPKSAPSAPSGPTAPAQHDDKSTLPGIHAGVIVLKPLKGYEQHHGNNHVYGGEQIGAYSEPQPFSLPEVSRSYQQIIPNYY